MNDLLFVNRMLVPEEEPLLSREATSGEIVRLVATAVSQVWELLELLRIGDNSPDVRGFLENLPSDAETDLALLRELYAGNGPNS